MNRPRTILTMLTMLVAGLSMPSCVGQLKQEALEKHFFHIDVAPPTHQGRPVSRDALRVMRLRASPSYAGQELIYKVDRHGFESDFYNVLLVPPADMLTQSLRDFVAHAGLFEHVVDASSLVTVGATLEGTINALYGDFSVEPPLAIVKMQFFLVQDVGAETRVLFAKDYEQRVPLEQATADGLIVGLTAAIEKTFNALVRDMRPAVASAPAD